MEETINRQLLHLIVILALLVVGILFGICQYVSLFNAVQLGFRAPTGEETSQHGEKRLNHSSSDADKRPKILFWTTFWGILDFEVGLGDAIYRRMNCSFLCENTIDKTLSAVSDAVMFHTIDSYWPLPVRRPKHQKWIFYTHESPVIGAAKDQRIDDIFNWTMTYHRNTSIYFPYGWLIRRQTPVPMQIQLTKRPKMAAWMVSHCNTHSKREELFDKLGEYVPVTKYGKCNGNYCDKGKCHGISCQKGRLECIRDFGKEYYFYLAWENALCDDYVTEKLWNALAEGLVPVVYGGAEYEQLLPPHSFIDALHFGSVKDLASYLTYFSTNVTAYREYLRWTEDYTIDIVFHRAWCDLCQKLYAEREQPTVTTVKAIDYWSVSRHCTRKEKDKNRLLLN